MVKKYYYIVCGDKRLRKKLFNVPAKDGFVLSDNDDMLLIIPFHSKLGVIFRKSALHRKKRGKKA